MAAWPTLGDLKLQLGVTDTAKDALLATALAAAIEKVQKDIGATVTVPSSSLAAAALLLAVTVSKAPDAPYGVAAVFDTGGLTVAAQHPTYQRLLVGQRQRFALA